MHVNDNLMTDATACLWPFELPEGSREKDLHPDQTPCLQKWLGAHGYRRRGREGGEGGGVRKEGREGWSGGREGEREGESGWVGGWVVTTLAVLQKVLPTQRCRTPKVTQSEVAHQLGAQKECFRPSGRGWCTCELGQKQ